MSPEGTFILSFTSIVIFSFIIWVAALAHAATNKHFKDSNSKLIWVLIIIFTYIIGAFLYLLFGRPKKEKTDIEVGKPSLIVSLFKKFGAMPFGIKLLTLLYIYNLVEIVLNIGKSPINYFGLVLNTPFSFLYTIASFVIFILILISFFNRYNWGWKLFMAGGILQLAIFLIWRTPITIKAIFSPASEIYKITNFTAAVEYQNPTSYAVTKFAYVGTGIFLLVIMMLVLLYVYKKRGYFSQ